MAFAVGGTKSGAVDPNSVCVCPVRTATALDSLVDEVYPWAKIRRPGVRRLRPAEIESLREDSRLALKIARVLHVLENVKQ